MDGSNIETIFITESHISGFALDINEDKLYWTDDVYLPTEDIKIDRGDQIRRASLDGSNIETLVTTEERRYSFTVAGGKLYWMEEERSTLEGEIRCANLDGSNIETLVTTEERKRIYNFTVAGGKLYWTERYFSSNVMCDFYHCTSPSKSSGFRLSRILSHTQIEWVSILVVHRLCQCQASRTFMDCMWKRCTNWA